MIRADEAIDLLRAFIRIDTTNPPGNEDKAAVFLENILKKAGIEARIFTPAPGRANILARITGRRAGKPVVLLSHMDVVPAHQEGWDVDPFGGELKGGFVYGRGAIDMKSQTICQLLAFIELYRQGITPEEDVLFLATCDEEVGGQNGVEYMLKEVVELRDASFVLSEGGWITEGDGVLHAQICVAEKKLSQFTIKATGRGGHGSMPHNDNANEKIVGASKAILSYEWPFRSTRIVNAYLNGILKGKKGKGFTFTSLRETLRNRRFREFIRNNPVYNALLRNTVTLTILKGGEKVNVIPTESLAYFDARLLPTEGHASFFARIRKLAGPDIEVTPIGTGMSEPFPSGYDTPYFKGLARAVAGMKGSIPVLPCVTTGATDLRYFRNLGILAYGFFPVTMPEEELLRMHGINERISVENIRQGLEGTYDTLKFLASLKAR
jgi:acetylornithine deacetylase/succinyl-diaminopimelate desuccinylase-like protein